MGEREDQIETLMSLRNYALARAVEVEELVPAERRIAAELSWAYPSLKIRGWLWWAATRALAALWRHLARGSTAMLNDAIRSH